MKEIYKTFQGNNINDNNLVIHYYLHLTTLNRYNIPNCSGGIYGSKIYTTSKKYKENKCLENTMNTNIIEKYK